MRHSLDAFPASRHAREDSPFPNIREPHVHHGNYHVWRTCLSLENVLQPPLSGLIEISEIRGI
ncbi:hypothetical protein X777_07281 [Ooceraea biroi]|uniref:Uncharacterized protein n=1 Tax=Ooceraea biroi TaxID=2015173 RepID=A0A026WAZ5_OOCBI|nr:hypothetical protein X777_07281 [Ooceraea biroi]